MKTQAEPTLVDISDRFDHIDKQFINIDKKIDELVQTLSEIVEVIHESFATSKSEVNERFDRLETRVSSIEKTMATKAQVEVLTDVLRTNGVISRFEARRIAKAQPSV